MPVPTYSLFIEGVDLYVHDRDARAARLFLHRDRDHQDPEYVQFFVALVSGFDLRTMDDEADEEFWEGALDVAADQVGALIADKFTPLDPSKTAWWLEVPGREASTRRRPVPSSYGAYSGCRRVGAYTADGTRID